MRFLIVDESSEFRRVLAGMLRARWPEAQTDEWDPRRRGNPAGILARERYNLVLLDSHPAGKNGIQWVAEMRKDLQAPPVILIADHGDTHVAIQAMKAGAADFLRKTGLTQQRLTRALEDALHEQEARHLESTGVNPVFARTVQLDTHRIGAPVQDNAGQIPGYRTLRLTCQIAKALDAIHAHNIVHRDLKPQNIMFRHNGRPVSQRLWGDEGPAGLVYLHVHGEIPLLPERLAGYQTIIDRLLAKKPEDRFQSAREFFATIAV